MSRDSSAPSRDAAAAAADDAWCTPLMPNPAARLRLFCFPYAGGRATLFRSWTRAMWPGVEIFGIQLPGRGERLRERPMGRVGDLLPPLAAAVRARIDRPFAFFGHSLGAILSFEVSRWLRRQYGLTPEHLFVSAHRAPHLSRTEPPSWDKSDEYFLAHVRAMNGTPPEVFESADLLSVLLPALRADFQLAETYAFSESAPLSCPITAFGGTEDEETSGQRLDAWRMHTQSRFRLWTLQGDHFFIHSLERELIGIVAGELNGSGRP